MRRRKAIAKAPEANARPYVGGAVQLNCRAEGKRHRHTALREEAQP